MWGRGQEIGGLKAKKVRPLKTPYAGYFQQVVTVVVLPVTGASSYL